MDPSSMSMQSSRLAKSIGREHTNTSAENISKIMFETKHIVSELETVFQRNGDIALVHPIVLALYEHNFRSATSNREDIANELTNQKLSILEQTESYKNHMHSIAADELKNLVQTFYEEKIHTAEKLKDKLLEKLYLSLQLVQDDKFHEVVTTDLRSIEVAFEDITVSMRQQVEGLFGMSPDEILDQETKKIDALIAGIETQYNDALIFLELQTKISREASTTTDNILHPSQAPSNFDVGLTPHPSVDIVNSKNVNINPEGPTTKMHHHIEEEDLLMPAKASIASRDADRLMTIVQSIEGDMEKSMKKLNELQDIKETMEMAAADEEEVVEKQDEIRRRRMSIKKLDHQIIELEIKITRLKREKDMAELELQLKRSELNTKMQAISELDSLLHACIRKMMNVRDEFQLEMERIARKRSEIMRRSDLSEASKLRLLQKIDAEEEELVRETEFRLKGLESEGECLQIDRDSKVSDVMKNVEKLQNEYDSAIAALEAQKENATPSELELINKKVEELKKQFDENMKKLTTGSKKLTDMTSLERIAVLNNLELTPSGHLKTPSGHMYTREQAEAEGIIGGPNMHVTPSGRIVTSDGRILTADEANELGLLGPDFRFTPSGNIETLSGTKLTKEQVSKRLGYKIASLINLGGAIGTHSLEKFILSPSGRILTFSGFALAPEDIARFKFEEKGTHYEIDGHLATTSGHILTRQEILDRGLVQLSLSGHVLLPRFDEKFKFKLSPSGRLLNMNGELLTPEELAKLNLGQYGLHYDEDGHLVTASGHNLTRQDLENRGLFTLTPSGHILTLPPGPTMYKFNLTPSGRLLALTGRILTPEEIARFKLKKHNVNYNPDGHLSTMSGHILSKMQIINRHIFEFSPSGHVIVKGEEELIALHFTASGVVVMPDGTRLTREQAQERGLLAPDKCTESQRTSEESVVSLLTSADVKYLKSTVGRPLTLGLAEITARKPSDPIHYLAHWLFKYRYNAENDVQRKLEIERLLDERERETQSIKQHNLLLDEAKKMIYELAETMGVEDVVETEGEYLDPGQLDEQSELDKKLEEEARDTVGLL